MRKYTLTIYNLQDEMESLTVELKDLINKYDYIVVNNRLIWIRVIHEDFLYGNEEKGSLEEFEYFIKDRLKC
ncbi:hypothetical protein AB1L07_02170 [Niallia alba]|uniref:hypothetical protein n=1 Tax=Niallia alba TaxID=2729105 RepID=UPI00399FAC6A